MPTAELVDRAVGSSIEAPDAKICGTRQAAGGRTWMLVTLAGALVGLGLRIGIIATRDLWADEAFTWRITSVEFDKMFHRVQGDVHPPLHYLLMWLLQERVPNGWGPAFLRLANLGWFVGMGALAAWSTRRPRFRVAVVPAFCVVAVAPGFVQHGAELRMYGMLLLLVALLLVAVTTIVERPTWLALLLGAVAATAAAWTHYAGVIAGTAIITAGLIQGGRKRFKSFVPLAAIFAVGVLILIPFALPQLAHGIGYRVGIARVGTNVLNNLGVVGIVLLLITISLAVFAGARRRVSVRRWQSTELARIALLSLGLLSAGMLAWYLARGQNPVNEGVSTIPIYPLLAGALALRIVPSQIVVAVVLLAGTVTAGSSVVTLWGAPNYSLGTRVSHVDVLDEAIRQHPILAADGGRGWLVV